MQDRRPSNIPTMWSRPDPAVAQKMLRNSAVRVAELIPRARRDTSLRSEGSAESSPIDYRNQIQSLESELQSINSQEATLADTDHEIEPPEKTPRPESFSQKDVEAENEADSTTVNSDGSELSKLPRIPGPLESDLLSLISKVARLEEGNPTAIFSNDEYLAMQERVKTLEAEKATWAARHEALFALRDEDVANVIKLRILLAEERREHEAMRKLRDDDLVNVLKLREKLADKTWKEEKEKVTSQQSPVTSEARTAGTSTPPSASGRPKSILLERRSTATDMWQAAKMAAMEQRALELERANADLLSKLEKTQSAQQPPVHVSASTGPSSKPSNDASDLTSAFEELEQQLRSKDEAIAAAQREITELRSQNTPTAPTPPITVASVNEVPKLRSTITDYESQLRAKDARIHILSQPHTQVQAQLLSGQSIIAPSSSHTSTSAEEDLRVAHSKTDSLRAQKNRLQDTMTRKVQDLRRERETLLRDLDRKEDEVAALEGRCDELERELRGARLRV